MLGLGLDSPHGDWSCELQSELSWAPKVRDVSLWLPADDVRVNVWEQRLHNKTNGSKTTKMNKQRSRHSSIVDCDIKVKF